MATDKVIAQAKVVAGPEELSNGGKKWTIALDNGSSVVTFTEAAFLAVNAKLDTPLIFEVEVNDKGYAPKLTKLMALDNTVLWEPKPRMGGGGFGRNEDAETARRSVGSAVAIVSSWQQATVAAGLTPFTTDEMVGLLGKLAAPIHSLMKDLEK